MYKIAELLRTSIAKQFCDMPKKDRQDAIYEQYIGMPFRNLVCVVFLPGGEPNPCPIEASMALITRLEMFYGNREFGNANTGEMNVLETYLASSAILAKSKFNNNGSFQTKRTE